MDKAEYAYAGYSWVNPSSEWTIQNQTYGEAEAQATLEYTVYGRVFVESTKQVYCNT
jgi:hypothetical protein